MLGCHEPLLTWMGCAEVRQVNKEGVRGFTNASPSIALPLWPCCDLKLLQVIADSVVVLQDSVLKTGNWVFSLSNLTSQGKEIMWKLSRVLRVSVLC